VYRRDPDRMPAFVEVGTPTDLELHTLLQTHITRPMKLITRRGMIVKEIGQTYLAEPDTDGDEARTLRSPRAAGNAADYSSHRRCRAPTTAW
jgi:hypothetical protein